MALHPIDRLLEIMDRLRDPQRGCPWDLKQTFRSIVPYTLEEAYEVAETIERGDLSELRDELGDLLFQVVFYARLAKERQAFDFHQVANGICEKMVRRHPHVFGEARFADDRALHAAWDQAKREERQERSVHPIESQLDGVPHAMPALMRAAKLQRRAARVGFDWPEVSGAIAKSREELREVEQALADGELSRIEDELGDLLFAVVNVTRMLGCDAEQTLRTANAKFERRFRAMEQRLAEANMPDLTALDLAEMDAAWEAVKAEERD